MEAAFASNGTLFRGLLFATVQKILCLNVLVGYVHFSNVYTPFYNIC